MAASSSWSQTELLSRPGRISQEEQQEGREAAREQEGGGLGEEVSRFNGKTRAESREPHQRNKNKDKQHMMLISSLIYNL